MAGQMSLSLTCIALQCAVRVDRQENERPHKRHIGSFLPSDDSPTDQFLATSQCSNETCAFHAEHPSIMTFCFLSPCSLRQARHGKGLEKMALAAPARTWLLVCRRSSVLSRVIDRILAQSACFKGAVRRKTIWRMYHLHQSSPPSGQRGVGGIVGSGVITGSTSKRLYTKFYDHVPDFEHHREDVGVWTENEISLARDIAAVSRSKVCSLPCHSCMHIPLLARRARDFRSVRLSSLWGVLSWVRSPLIPFRKSFPVALPTRYT